MADNSALPWTEQQWQSLRSVIHESARRARIASRFLPGSGAAEDDDGTVASLWTNVQDVPAALREHPGVAPQRLEARSGKDLHLITISTNLFLRGADVADPDLKTVKSLVARHAEVLARLEDAIIFQGFPKDKAGQDAIFAKVKPQIYTVTGGSDFTGLLQSPETFLDTIRTDAGGGGLTDLEKLNAAHDAKAKAIADGDNAARDTAQNQIAAIADDARSDVLVVRSENNTAPAIVHAVVKAVGKLNTRRSGPYAAVFDNQLFQIVNKPSDNMVLPSTSIENFLEGGRLYRSQVLPDKTGIVVALGGDPIELVLGSDIDAEYVQKTLDSRYVLRVFERLVLRIKELDAVCRIVLDPPILNDGFRVRKASK